MKLKLNNLLILQYTGTGASNNFSRVSQAIEINADSEDVVKKPLKFSLILDES